ncbi:MAG: hypothetical protein IKO36_03725 [Bacteroidaceae bacterium]|nr:hypothetical protein [Bacteroidaceae bacterium]
MAKTTDFTIFMEVFNRFQEQYPNRNLRMNGTIVEIDGQQRFNIDGFNLLYNLKRLVGILADELY